VVAVLFSDIVLPFVHALQMLGSPSKALLAFFSVLTGSVVLWDHPGLHSLHTYRSLLPSDNSLMKYMSISALGETLMRVIFLLLLLFVVVVVVVALAVFDFYDKILRTQCLYSDNTVSRRDVQYFEYILPRSNSIHNTIV
jgi:hypothetical protein